MMNKNLVILGAGMTGLSAGIGSKGLIFEAKNEPGGICSSYYIQKNGEKKLHNCPEDEEVYRFEEGGGHWIFGGDPVLNKFLSKLVKLKFYHRKSSVFFPDEKKYVPYPIQNNLGKLDKEIGAKALEEILNSANSQFNTMEEWLTTVFGKTLVDYFFGPFHDLYTAGLWKKIAPQDPYKSPINKELVIKGFLDEAPPVGYNTTFLYPERGLDVLSRKLSEMSDVHFGKKVVSINTEKKLLQFEDGYEHKYDTLISSLPLNLMVKIANIEIDEKPDPYTSVLVLNIGALKGELCPDDHWLYIPKSNSGFHRVGFYSNVDSSFLPKSSRYQKDRVSIYVEKAFLGGIVPTDQEVENYIQNVIKELQDWRFISDVEVVDPTWIEVAYTWKWPGSNWVDKSIKKLRESDIIQVGRYGRWHFQGIAASIREGFSIGSILGAI